MENSPALLMAMTRRVRSRSLQAFPALYRIQRLFLIDESADRGKKTIQPPLTINTLLVSALAEKCNEKFR